MSEDRVLVEYEGKYRFRVIASTPEAGRRKIVASVKAAGYEPSEYMKDIDNFQVTRLAELKVVDWR